MKKKRFILFTVFMSLSLIGVIIIQGFWIYTSISNIQEEFDKKVNESLFEISKRVYEKELNEFITKFESIIDFENPINSEARNVYMFYNNDNKSNLSTLYTYGILEEKYRIPLDSISSKLTKPIFITDFKQLKTKTIFSDNIEEQGNSQFYLQNEESVNRLNELNLAEYENLFSEIANTFAIQERLNPYELEFLIKQEFRSHNILIPFEFSVYTSNMQTKIKSKGYINEKKNYETPIFIETSGNNRYALKVNFPNENYYILSNIIWIAILSVFLTLSIVLMCSLAIYQIIKQKKISTIKSDFINNMSHEFKTPIATINLVVDAIQNPKNINNPENIAKYLGIIKEENIRMKTQVESVLSISQLEKKGMPLELTKVDVHEIIAQAISHFSIILKNNNGVLIKNLKAEHSLIMADKTHLTNAIINLIDNAIKYSENTIEVTISTFSEKENLIIEIKDKGIGMSPATQKLIFEKFYRAQKGNIHTVKGHGLGLTYTKDIVKMLNGTIYVKSKLGEGSVFKIYLPLVET